MRPGCECCDVDLPADDVGAVVCSFECTFCAGCAEHLERTCPNCGGALMPRPTRVGDALARHPASTTRVVSDAACPGPGYAGRVHARRRRSSGWAGTPSAGASEREALDALLDEVLAGTLSTVVDGRPWVVPMLFARDGDRVLLHGSTGAGALRQVAAGAPAVLSVTVVDGLVVAHTTFESSANYRSAVIHGELTPLGDAERTTALELHLAAADPRAARRGAGDDPPRGGRDARDGSCRSRDGRWLLKERSGGASVPDEETDAWSGVVPFRVVAGAPEPSPWSAEAGTPVPASVTALVERWTP